MSTQLSDSVTAIEQLRAFLRDEGYGAGIQRHYPPIARRFLAYLEDQNESVETAQPSDLEGFLRKEDRAYRKRHSRAPRDIRAWRVEHAAPARLLLRLVQGHWPRELPPTSRRQDFHRSLLSGYDAWMRELRGLAETTRHERVTDAFMSCVLRQPAGTRHASVTTHNERWKPDAELVGGTLAWPVALRRRSKVRCRSRVFDAPGARYGVVGELHACKLGPILLFGGSLPDRMVVQSRLIRSGLRGRQKEPSRNGGSCRWIPAPVSLVPQKGSELLDCRDAVG